MTVESSGSTTSEAPTDNDAKKQDETTQQLPADTGTQPDASGADQPSDPKEAVPPAAEATKEPTEKKTAPEVTEEAIQREIENHPVLSKLAGKHSDKPKEKAKEQEQEKTATAATKTEKPKGEAKADKVEDIPEELPADPKDHNRIFAALRTQLRDAKKAAETLKADEADVTFGREIADVLIKHEAYEDFRVVADEQLAGVVKIQAALNRAEHAAANGGKLSEADRKLILAARGNLDAIAGKAGLEIEQMPKPITGALPDRWNEMVEMGLLSEDEARIHAALDASKAKRSDAPAEKRQAEEKPKETVQEPFTRRMPEQRQPPKAANADEYVARNLTRTHLVEQGIPKEQVSAHYKGNLLPIVLDELVAPVPGSDAVKTFLDLSPMAQHVLIEKAQARWQGRKKELEKPAGATERKAGERPAQPLIRRQHGRGLPSFSSTSDSQRTLDFLAGKASQPA